MASTEISPKEVRKFLQKSLHPALEWCDVRRLADHLRAANVISADECETLRDYQKREDGNRFLYSLLEGDPCCDKLESLCDALQMDTTHRGHRRLAESVKQFLPEDSVPLSKKPKYNKYSDGECESSELSQTEPQTSQTAHQTEPQVSQTADHMEPQASQTADQTEPQASQTADQMEPQVSQTADQTEPKASQTADQMEPQVSQTADQTEPQVSQTADQTEPQVSQTADQTATITKADTLVKPTILDLQYVTESVAVNHSDGICRRLGVNEAVLSQAEQDYPLGTAGASGKRFMCGLQDWFNGNGVLDGRPVTLSVLCKALEESRYRSVAEELRKQSQERPFAISTSPHSDVTPGLSENALTKLKEVYQSPVISNHWSLKLAVMDFVKLQLVESPELKMRKAELQCAPSVVLASATGQSHDIKGNFVSHYSRYHHPYEHDRPHFKGNSISLQEILEYEPVRPPMKHILVEGEPGIGKSTLTKQLCYKFAEGTFASEYKLVIRVVLRGLPSDTTLSVEDLVCSCTSDFGASLDEEDVSTLSRYITANKGKDTLFIMDGYDEFPEKLQEKSLIADILNGKTLPQSSFVITSRPRASAPLHDKIERRIEVSGFGEKEIEQFVREYYGESSSSVADALLARLNSTLPRIKAMCFIPLILLMTCYVNDVLDVPPDTISDLFKSLICLTVKRHFEKNEVKLKIGSFENVLRLCPRLIKLSQLALDGVLKDDIIFHNLELSEDDHFGLMNCISYRSAFGGVTGSYHFLHRTIQEFLAACAVKQLPAEEQRKFWKERLVLGYNKRGNFVLSDSSYEMPFLFFCGIVGLENDAVRDLLFEPLAFTNDHRFARGTPFTEIATAVAETRNEGLCQRVMECCSDADVYDLISYPQQLNSLAYLMTISRHIKRLSILYPTDSFIQQLSGKVTYLEEVTITASFETLAKSVLLQDFLKLQSSLNKLTFNERMHRPSVRGDYISALSDIVLFHSKRLEHLAIQFKREEASSHVVLKVEANVLMSFVVTCRQLKSLSLESVTFTHKDLKVLLESLPQLITMEMKGCDYEGGDIDIVNCIRSHPSLEDVTLCGENIVNLIKVFLFGIKDKQNMKRLRVSLTEYSSKYADFVKLLQCVVSCMKKSSLKTLSLRWMEGVPQCCEVFDCLRSSEIEEFEFELNFSFSLPEGLTDLVECGVGQCRTLRKVTIGAGTHQTLTSSILKGMIQNTSLEQVELIRCNFKGNRALLMELLQSGLKSVTLSYSYTNITPTDIANIIRCLRDNTTLKELTIRTIANQSEDVTERDVLISVEQAVKENTTLERLTVYSGLGPMNLRNVSESILKGAAANQNLRELKLLMNKEPKEYAPKQEVIDNVRKVNRKLRLTVKLGTFVYL